MCRKKPIVMQKSSHINKKYNRIMSYHRRIEQENNIEWHTQHHKILREDITYDVSYI